MKSLLKSIKRVYWWFMGYCYYCGSRNVEVFDLNHEYCKDCGERL